MTDKEKAIVMAHTGICMLTGKKFQIFHKYVEDIMNRPIMTHEIGCLADEIKEKSKADFIALCANENNVEEEQEPRWIPVSERLPEKNMSCLVSVGKFHFTDIAQYSDLMKTIDHKIFYKGDYGKNNFINITKYVCAWMPLPKDYREEKVQNAKEVEEEK